MIRTILLILVLGGFLAAAIAGTIYYWLDFNDVELSGHGIAALILGVVVSLALGIGLMRLVYESDRRGFD